MASVKVKFRRATAEDKPGRVYYQIIHKRKIRQISTDLRLYPHEWKEGTVSTEGVTDRYSYLLKARARIKEDLDRFHNIIREMESRTEYGAEDIIGEFLRKTKDGGLFGYMDRIVTDLRKNGRIRTSETYQATKNSFVRFREGEDIGLDSLTRNLLEEYEGWLRQDGKCMNTISFYMRILRAVYKRAVEEGMTEDRRIFSKVYTGIDKTVKRAVPMNIMKRIMTLDLETRPDLSYSRDMFILSFMLRGMSFVDMANLRKSDLRNDILTYRRKKTGQLLSIRWTEEMQRIKEKYPENEGPYLLPIIRNPESIAFYAIRNANYKVSKGLKEIGELVGSEIPLTMYVARHSWASAAKAKGVPISIISEGLGHESERTTQIYLASLDGSVIDRVNGMLLKELG